MPGRWGINVTHITMLVWGAMGEDVCVIQVLEDTGLENILSVESSLSTSVGT